MRKKVRTKTETMKIVGILFFLLVFSCSKEKTVTDESIVLGKIISIETLKTISLGQNDSIIVTFTGGTNGCYKPHHLEKR